MTTPNSLIGRHIDQFRLDHFIAKGAMGLIFKAFDTVLVRSVALKLISKRIEEDLTEEELTIREEARKRLIQEAKAAGRLNHPNILTIFSYGETEEFEYICMEHVTGKTLTQLLQERKIIEPAEAIDIGEQILMALDAANREQIVHRDIKPSNIMITEDGRLKVMDFGITKLPSFSMTTTGTVLGTPYYMSPEQISGQKVDIRSDIFSTGAVLYQIMTGERPFEATNTATLAYKIVQVEPVPPDVLNVHIPHPLGAIVKKALAKNPNDRYQTPVEMLKDLRLLKQEEMARERSSADATVKVSVPEADATVQVHRADLRIQETPRPDDYASAPGEAAPPDKTAVDSATAAPKIKLVSVQADTDREREEAAQDAVVAKRESSSDAAPGPEPPRASEDKDKRETPEDSGPGKADAGLVGPPARAVRPTGAPSTSGPGRAKGQAAALSGSGGKYALAAILCLALLGGGLLVNSLVKGKSRSPQSAAPGADRLVADQATPSAQPGQKEAPEGASSSVQTQSPGRTAALPASDNAAVESLLLQVKSRQWENDPVQTQKLLEKALAIDPNHFEATFQLARVLTHRQEYARAIEVYKRALTLNNQAPEVYFNLGYIHLNQGSYDAAIQNYEACLALNPAYKDEVLTNLGIAYLKKNQEDRAQQLFQQALDINPSNFVARSYVRGTSGSSPTTQPPPSGGTPTEPVASVQKPPTQTTQRAIPLIDQAKTLMQANAPAAEKLLREAVGLEPDNFEPHLQLGRLYTFQKKYETAIGHYEKALALNDQAPDASFNLGFIYMTLKDYDRAIRNYEASLGLKPPYTDEVLTNLGLCYLKKNAPGQARTLFQEALDWNPKNEIARNYLKQLDKAQAGKPGGQKGLGGQGGTILTEVEQINGEYAVAGVNPGGSRYEGTALIRRSGDRYQVDWQIGNETFSGSGTLVGDTLTVNWKGSGGSGGLIIYTMMTNGVLKGVWAGGSGSETLTPAP